MALGVRLITSRINGEFEVGDRTAWIVTTCLFCCLCPLDYCNFILRTSIPIERMPRQSHALNLLMEVPMMALNIYLIFA